MSKRTKQQIGWSKEEEALAFLEKAGYRWVNSNYRNRYGEIDLVVENDAALVFVEVKYRGSTEYGSPEEAVTPAKRTKLMRAACGFFERESVPDKVLRFDVVSIGPDGIRHFENAFPMGSRYYL